MAVKLYVWHGRRVDGSTDMPGAVPGKPAPAAWWRRRSAAQTSASKSVWQLGLYGGDAVYMACKKSRWQY